MNLINHLGEQFELEIEQYHIANSFKELYSSDWLDVKLCIQKEKKRISYAIDLFLVEDLERICNWITNTNSKKKLYFVDTNLVFVKATRCAIPFLKVIYYLTNKNFISWDLELNVKNIENLKTTLNKKLKMYPCRCGQEHNYIN